MKKTGKTGKPQMNTDEHRFGGKVKTPTPRRVEARGLQETAETAMRCRPSAITKQGLTKQKLTEQTFKQEPSQNDIAKKAQMNTDEHRFKNKVKPPVPRRVETRGLQETAE